MSTEQLQDEHVQLPSIFFIKQGVYLQFNEGDTKLRSTVRGIHFYEGKIKYDLAIWLNDNTETRIYNVDSCFVTPA